MDIVLHCVNGLLFTLSLLNLGVMGAILAKKTLRTANNVQIFNICLAGLLFNSSLPFVMSMNAAKNWNFGFVLCKIVYGVEAVAKTASSFTIAIASFERAQTVVTFRQKPYFTLSSSLIFAVLTWVVSSTLMSPVFVFATQGQINQMMLNGTNVSGVTICSLKYPSAEFYYGFMAYVTILVFIIPTVIIVSSYGKILYTIYTSTGKLNVHSNRAEEFHESTTNIRKKSSTTRLAVSRTNDSSRDRRFRKVPIVILSIVTFHILCWTPYWSLMTLIGFGVVVVSNSGLLRQMTIIVHFLPYINSALNPLIYGLLTENFRNVLLSPCTQRKQAEFFISSFDRNRFRKPKDDIDLEESIPLAPPEEQID